jgi:ferredoxin
VNGSKSAMLEALQRAGIEVVVDCRRGACGVGWRAP